MLSAFGHWPLCLLLSLLGVGPLMFCGAYEVRGIEQPTELHGAHAILRFVTVFTADGERTAVWRTSDTGTLWWLRDPERIAFVAPVRTAPAYVGGDPASGRLSRLNDFAEQPEDHQATVAEPGPWPDGWRWTDEGARFRDRLVLANMGFEVEVQTSPSGRWIVVTQRQPKSSTARYLISPDGRELQLLELVVRGPVAGAEKQWRSPDGRWVAEPSPAGLVLRRDDDEPIVLPVGTGLPAWAPDSSAVATLNEHGIVVARPDRSVRQLVWGCCSLRVDEWTEQGIVYVAGNYGGSSE